MYHLDLILTLTGGLATALVLGYLTHRLGLSPIVGYLVGGIVVGDRRDNRVASLSPLGVELLVRVMDRGADGARDAHRQQRHKNGLGRSSPR